MRPYHKLALKVKSLGDGLRNLHNGNLFLLADRKNDGVDLLVLAEGPDKEARKILGKDKLAKGLARSPDSKVLALLCSNS